MARYKGCPRCGRKMPRDIRGQCEECRKGRYKYMKKLNGITRDKTQSVYSSNRWEKTRQEVIKRSKGICEVCYSFGRVVTGKEVHHIIKVRVGNDVTNYDLDNLLYLCTKCHKRVEGMDHRQLLAYIEKGGGE